MIHFDPMELAGWCGGQWQGPPPEAISGVGNDSRVIQRGHLYVALRGERLDGHDFVKDAQLRSAGGALVDRAYVASVSASAVAEGPPLLVVEDTARALFDVARGHRARCQGEFIGITGSVGKTSVKEMTADVLAAFGGVARTPENWNNHIGLPLSLLRMQPTDRFGVFEVGMNHPGELAPLCDLLQPSRAIMTPIGPGHLEFFDSIDAIAEEKATLLKSLPEEGTAILSLDDPWYGQLMKHVHSRVIRISLQNEEADYYGERDPDTHDLLWVHERASRSAHRYRMPLPGQYVADNALRAIAMGRECGLDPDVIAHAVVRYQTLSMRWNKVRIAGIDFINDAYNANPMSMRAALNALQEWPVNKRKWLVLAGMFELGATEQVEHEALGHYLAQFPWAGVVTIGRLGQLIAQGAIESGATDRYTVQTCTDRWEAADCLEGQLSAGDIVLVKASRGEKLEDVLYRFEDLKAPKHEGLL